jgi:hypothetical protein
MGVADVAGVTSIFAHTPAGGQVNIRYRSFCLAMSRRYSIAIRLILAAHSAASS